MKHFSIVGFLTGLLGLVIITSSSMYVALRMGALPWPTVFVTVLAMTVMGKTKHGSLQEINVTHTFMSAGAMVAGGLAFTLPGIWILNPGAHVDFFQVLEICVLGAVLGALFSAVFRKNLIEEQSLVFPIGNAAYQTLVTGINRGRESVKLFVSMAFSVVFTIFRDALGFFPAVLNFFKGSSAVPQIDFWVSPMALAIGAVIDSVAALFWFAGSVISYFILAPVGCSDLFRQNVGIGLMIGTGAGILIKIFHALFSGKSGRPKMRKRDLIMTFAIVFVSAILMALTTELSAVQAFTAVLLTGISCLLSGMLTGQSGINPMEIFGILVMLAVGVIKSTSTSALFLIASLTAVACGLSGDVMNDLKSGYLVHTDPEKQIVAEFVGGIIGAFISVVCLFAMKRAFGSFGTSALPAPQAKAVASMASGFGNSCEFFISMAIGAILFLCKLPSATLGLGIYLSMQISLPVSIGAFAAYLYRKKAYNNDINLIASGLLGGEGIAGVLIAIFSMF